MLFSLTGIQSYSILYVCFYVKTEFLFILMLSLSWEKNIFKLLSFKMLILINAHINEFLIFLLKCQH